MQLVEKLVIKAWLSFLKDSAKKRDHLIQGFEKTLKGLDESVKRQRAVTGLFLKRILKLEEGDVIHFADDGTYTVEKGGALDGTAK